MVRADHGAARPSLGAGRHRADHLAHRVVVGGEAAGQGVDEPDLGLAHRLGVDVLVVEALRVTADAFGHAVHVVPPFLTFTSASGHPSPCGRGDGGEGVPHLSRLQTSNAVRARTFATCSMSLMLEDSSGMVADSEPPPGP